MPYRTRNPLIVGLGGTARPTSSTECALRVALAAAERAGAETTLFGGETLSRLPLYGTAPLADCGIATTMIETVRRADGILIASPGYHGSVSGLVKNAIDYIEETAKDPRAYLDGLPVGLIVTAFGWQATGSTLAALRSIVHALRGWPTPLGIAINSSATPFEGDRCTDEKVDRQLAAVGEQVVRFAMLHRAAASDSLAAE